MKYANSLLAAFPAVNFTGLTDVGTTGTSSLTLSATDSRPPPGLPTPVESTSTSLQTHPPSIGPQGLPQAANLHPWITGPEGTQQFWRDIYMDFSALPLSNFSFDNASFD